MKVYTTVLLLLLSALLAGATLASAAPFGWTISASVTDPYVHETPPTMGIFTWYLWLVCGDAEGMTGAEFSFVPADIDFIISLGMAPGFANVGTNENPRIVALTGCVSGPVRVGSITMFDAYGPGELCLGVNADTGNMGTYDCAQALRPITQIGCSSLGTPPSCNDELCADVTSTESNTWGGVKTLFR